LPRSKPTRNSAPDSEPRESPESSADSPTARRSPMRLGVEERRRQLLDLGKKLFAEHAYDELSTDQLARLAGVSAGLLYHYFPSKRDYYVATIAEVAHQVSEDTAPIAGATPQEAVHRSLESFVRFVEENERLYRALVTGGIGSDRDVHAILQGLRDKSAGRVIEVLGITTPSSRQLLAAFGWIGFIEFACLKWVESPSLSREQLLEILEHSLFSLMGSMLDS
jgi:AcrR family transcriptional regulator